MAAVLEVCSGAISSSLGASQTQTFALAECLYDNSTIEARTQIVRRTGGTLSNAIVRIVANDRGTSTYITRKNATTNGTVTASITSSTTGEFSDITHSDTVTAGDKWVHKITTGAGGTTFTVGVLGIQFTAASGTVKRLAATGATTVAQGLTRYLLLAGSGTAPDSVEANEQQKIRTAGTLSNLCVNVLANTVNAASTGRTRVGAANGAQSVSITASTTGFYEDTTNSDSVTTASLCNYQLVTGAGTGSMDIYSWCVDFTSTDSTKFPYHAGISTPGTIGLSATVNWALGGSSHVSTTPTEANLQTNAQIAGTMTNLIANIIGNTITATSTLFLRQNAGNAGNTLSITASTSGIFEDTTHSDTIAATDELALQLITGGTGTTLKISGIGVLLTTGSSSDSVNVFDSITVAENITSQEVYNINVSDNITISESPTVSLVNKINVFDSIKISDVRNNYIVNPGFETNALYWSAGGTASKAQSTAQQYLGNDSLLMTATTNGDSVYATLGDGVTYATGQTYTFSAYLKGSGTVTLWVYDGVSDNFSSPITLSGTWTRASYTFTCQSASGILMGVRLTSSNSVSCYIDAVMVEDGNTAGTYFDGSTFNASWTGTADNSTSIMGVQTSLTTNADSRRKAVIHTGSYSIDNNTLTQTQINALVYKIVSNIPNTTYIAIGTYLDYPIQIKMWASAIHNYGKRMWLRSAGFNDWQGTNSVTQYTSSDFASHSTTQYTSFINSNFSIFQSGDVFETVPDEPENNSVWNATYGTIGSGTGQTAYNSFITNSISAINTALSNNSVTGVDTGYVHTNPSASKDVITSATAAVMTAMGTDDYPELVTDTTGALCAASMLSEINTWIKEQQAGKPWHMTIGPNIKVQLSTTEQENAYNAEWTNILAGVIPLDGLTIWQAGGIANPLSRIFDYSSGVWTARAATADINTIFGNLPLSERAAHDNVNVSESTTSQLVNTVNVFDSITVAETVTAKSTFNINVFDGINVSEGITATSGPQTLSVFDSVTVAEVITTSPTFTANVFDSVTASESVSAKMPVAASVFDSVTISESTTPSLVNYVSVFDSVTVAESVASQSVNNISVFDSVTVAETVTVSSVLTVNVFDSVNTQDVLTYYADSIYVSEFVQISIISATPQANVFDSVTVAETVTVLVPSLKINVFDSVTAAELVTASNVYLVNVFDSVTVAESVVVSPTDFLSIFDSITIAETITASPTDGVSVFDGVNISEAITSIIPSGNASVFDSVTVSESTTGLVPSGSANAFDSVTVSESVTASIISPSGLIANVFDSITVSESTTALIPSGQASVFDSITVSESTAATIISPSSFDVNVSDSVTASESITSCSFPLTLSVFDSVTVSETTTGSVITPVLFVSVFDSTTVTETIDTLDNGARNINVSDSIKISEFVDPLRAGARNIFVFDTIGPYRMIWDDRQHLLMKTNAMGGKMYLRL